MSRVAVVGAGISGLAAAWLLSRRHDVVLLERDDRLGGHTHTHHLTTDDGPLALDTGFIVHNDRTYPLLVRLFDEIGVERIDSDMSFGVHDPATGFEYSTRDLNGLFADRRLLLRPSHYRLLADLLRFNRLARRGAGMPDDRRTLGDFLDQHGFSRVFVDRYLAPLASAIWSAPTATIRDFPLATLVRFFDQHGMLNIGDHPTWRVVRGGSATYIPKLIAPSRITVMTSAPPTRVDRQTDGVRLTFERRPPVTVDHVVFACHGDEVLPLLGDATPLERDVLSAFTTTTNVACLHTDARLLPRRAAARAAWNYQIGSGSTGATVTYDLNRLQGLTTRRRYAVTLNPPASLDPSRILARMVYTHPLYTRAAVQAQARWNEISGPHRTHYCGAYWYYGFHEDGLRSAVRVAATLGVVW